MSTSRPSRHPVPAILAVVLAACFQSSARAQQAFIPFDARSTALGGASVGLPVSATTFVDNPASTPKATLGGVFSIGGIGEEANGFLDPLDALAGLDKAAVAEDPAALARALGDLAHASAPGSGIPGTGRIGLASVVSGVGMTLIDTRWAGVVVRPDTVHVLPGSDPDTSFLYNTSRLAYRGLKVRDLGVSIGTSASSFSVGLAGHVLRGTTSFAEEDVFTADICDTFCMARRSSSGAERTRTRFSWDAGGLVKVGTLQLAVVMKAINRPQFPISDAAPEEDRAAAIVYGRQTRAGASFEVPGVLTLVADLDLTSNETLVPGLESRVLGGGLEFKLGPLAVRGGASVNLEEESRTPTITGGLGFNLGPVHVDASAMGRFDGTAIGGVISARAGL